MCATCAAMRRLVTHCKKLRLPSRPHTGSQSPAQTQSLGIALQSLLQLHTSLTPSQIVCRYLYVDHMLTAVQASPQNKVATLSSESLELMASARAELQCMSKQVCQHQASFISTYHLLVTVYPGAYCVFCRLAKFSQSSVLCRLSSHGCFVCMLGLPDRGAKFAHCPSTSIDCVYDDKSSSHCDFVNIYMIFDPTFEFADSALNVTCLCIQDDDREVVARGTHDCWVVARHRNGRELYLVMEGKGEVGLAGASKLAHDFADSHFPSHF